MDDIPAVDAPADPVFMAGDTTPTDTEQYAPRCLEGEYVPIKPFGKRLLVIRNPFKQMGRIYIPDTARQAPTTGRVVAIGSEIPKEHYVKLNMMVCFGQYDGKDQAIVDDENTVRVFCLLHIDELLGELVVPTERLRFPKKDGTYE
jgi:co-chaperonin GroES (HSP10)